MDAPDARKDEAWRKAVDDLKNTDIREAAPKGLVACKQSPDGDFLIVECFGHPLRVSIPSFEFEAPSIVDLFTFKILALRYLAKADGAPVTGEWVDYRDLPGGMFYAATIPPTVEEPLAHFFGHERWSLTDIAPALNGKESEYGDESFVFHAFPRVPLLVVLHWGKDEFPPGARFLFDRCCSHYLNTDDCKILATQAASLLIRMAGGVYASGDDPAALWMVD